MRCRRHRTSAIPQGGRCSAGKRRTSAWGPRSVRVGSACGGSHRMQGWVTDSGRALGKNTSRRGERRPKVRGERGTRSTTLPGGSMRGRPIASTWRSSATPGWRATPGWCPSGSFHFPKESAWPRRRPRSARSCRSTAEVLGHRRSALFTRGRSRPLRVAVRDLRASNQALSESDAAWGAHPRTS